MAPITRAHARRARDASSADKPSPPNGLVVAPQRPYSPPMTRARRARYASSSDRLPADVLSDILKRLPAKDLCRLRTVCRSWRSITSDADFIREHADSHKEPLLLAKFRNDKTHVYVVNLSGNVVKRIAGAGGGLEVVGTRLDLACLATEWNKCRVLNPATGGIRQVPPLLANRGVILRNACTFFAFGLVASRGEYNYKLLCCLITFDGVFARLSGVQLRTINGDTTGTDHAQWRRMPHPPLSIDVHSRTVVDGVVYFLTSHDYLLFHDGVLVRADYILSFDLANEQWRRILHGPSSTGNLTSGPMERSELTLADLNGSLVLAHHPGSLLIMDLWFLLDFESRLWVKQYNIRTESVTRDFAPGYNLIPLLALDDGQLVIYVAPYGLLFKCDPGTNTFTRVKTRGQVFSVSVYTGSLLSLQEGHMV